MKRETKVLVFLFILAFVIRLAFVFSTPVQIWDETVYANLGYDLSKNIFDYSFANNGWSDFIPFSEGKYSWPNAGFRAPLLPYILSILYALNLNFLVILFIPLIGALSVVLIYYLGKRMFNKKIAFYSSIFFLLIPLHVIYSAKILTGVLSTFFVLLAFLSFWKGYEESSRKHKLLFGFFLALALLTRYTTLWIIPIFLIYFLVRDKSLIFLKDKYLWGAIGIFFLTLVPWFIYGFFTYNNLFGSFIHGIKAAAYWGGTQPWYFFFSNGWIFSIIGIIFIFSLVYILYKKQFIKKEVYLLLIWVIFFLGMAMIVPHKEGRFILPIVPAVCLLSGFFINKIKKRQSLILVGIILILILSLVLHFFINYKNSYTDTNSCFLEGNQFLKDVEENSVVITDESPIVYYYSKKETHFYPSSWSIESLKKLVNTIYIGRDVYILFTDYDMSLDVEKNIQIKLDLDNNFEKVFECHKKNGLSIIYKY